MAITGTDGTNVEIDLDIVQPTAQLRFVERAIPIHPADTVEVARKVRILQQQWRSGELVWRDVPLELEG